MINYIVTGIVLFGSSCCPKHAFIWRFQKIEFSGKVWKFMFFKLHKIIYQNNQPKSLMINYIIVWTFFFFFEGGGVVKLLLEIWFYVKIAENWVFGRFRDFWQICVKYLIVLYEMFWASFFFVFLIKKRPYLMNTKGWLFGIFCRWVFCKLL